LHFSLSVQFAQKRQPFAHAKLGMLALFSTQSPQPLTTAGIDICNYQPMIT
jgi:hypothetical protein